MRPSSILLPLACAGTLAAAAGGDGFLELAGGIHYPTAELRDLTGSNYGMHLNAGLGAYGQAMIGFPTFEIDWGHVTGNGNRLDTVDLTYCERVRLQEGIYVGAGAGTAWNRLVLVDADGEQTAFRLCLRGMVGMTLFRQFFIECAVFYNGKVDDLDANAVALLAGVRF